MLQTYSKRMEETDDDVIKKAHSAFLQARGYDDDLYH